MKTFQGTILFSLIALAGAAACDRNSDRSTTPAPQQQTMPSQTSMGDDTYNSTNNGNLDTRGNDTGNTGADSPAGQQGTDAAQGTGTSGTNSGTSSGTSGTGTSTGTGTTPPQTPTTTTPSTTTPSTPAPTTTTPPRR